MKLTVNVDGGARGNPGPAAIGVVIRDDQGRIIDEHGERIGDATNNVAEYRALLSGVKRALALGGTDLDLVGDSELVVKQVRGEYKVKNAGIKPLHAEVRKALATAGSWEIRHVRREQNAEADRLVNEVLDG
jgi:ribonuclease HI